jgi:hypothetical protein
MTEMQKCAKMLRDVLYAVRMNVLREAHPHLLGLSFCRKPLGSKLNAPPQLCMFDWMPIEIEAFCPSVGDVKLTQRWPEESAK